MSNPKVSYLVSNLVFESPISDVDKSPLTRYRTIYLLTICADFRVQCLARCSFESSIRNASGDATDSMSVTELSRLFKRDVLSSSKPDNMCEYDSEKLTLLKLSVLQTPQHSWNA